MSTKETFSNKLSFIFSALGCAVGCGNIWRFPYLVGKYGGGIFLLMYLVILFAIACPLLTMEFSLGRLTRKEPIAAYQEVSKTKGWGITGFLGIAVSFCWLAYLTPIFGILVGYLFKFMTGSFDGMSPTEIANSYEVYRTQGNLIAAQSMILLVIIAAALLKGVRKGLERLNNICMPSLIIILILLCIRSLTLPGVGAGLDFYLRPDFSKFTAEALIAALGQALFSVGVGVGCGIVFGSYLPDDKTNLSKNSIVVCLGDTAIAFCAGLMIFPSIFSFGLEPSAGSGLLFITLPNVFVQLPWGNLIAVLTVLLFMLAMLTSQIACLETLVCFATERFKISRSRSLAVIVPIMAALAWLNSVSTVSFDWFDWVTSYVFLNGGALISSIFFGWVWGPERALNAAGITSHREIWAFAIKYVVPAALLVINITSLCTL
ncbi:sodium-dependent transporter [Cloacibacillus sp.]|uniref:sodium-dependent transporter n=1 Tax=Cloacibacillus sp. TaxID=2049023 RepID=UPI0025C37FD7|nr:sodium-dependent transporter [Cloacibacillus sp.]MCC8058278.1 sodium-dependent transporter [Cloacibacillus sp.]